MRAKTENSWFSSSCPYGSASSYSKLYGSGRCKDIQLRQNRSSLSDMTSSGSFLIILFCQTDKLKSCLIDSNQAALFSAFRHILYRLSTISGSNIPHTVLPEKPQSSSVLSSQTPPNYVL